MIKMGLGKIQRLIVEYLMICGGATSKSDLQAFAALFSIDCACVSRSAWRLEKRGMVRCVGLDFLEGRITSSPLSERELEAVRNAAESHPRAHAFWVLTDAAMDVLGEEV